MDCSLPDSSGHNIFQARVLEWVAISFSNLVPIHCSMSNSNCYCLTCIQISQEAGKGVWYFHLIKNFPQFVVIHTVKGFSIASEAEVDVFLESSCFFYDTMDVGYFISGPSAFSKYSLNFWKFLAHVLLKLCLKNFEKRYKKLLFWAYCALYSRKHAYVLSPFSHVQLFVTPWT